MSGSFVKGCVVGLLCALVGGATVALAGSGVGGVFNLGQQNTVDAQTSLTGNPGGNPELKVVSNGSATAIRGETNSADPSSAGVVAKNNGAGTGLKAIVNAGAPPLVVNSSVKVLNLNADQLDGLDSSALQRRVTGTCAGGEAISEVNSDGSVTCVLQAPGEGWSLTGNAGTDPAANFLGTTDNQALVFKVNGQRALRLEPNADSPNLIGGFSGNSVAAGVFGATIAGGGVPGAPNTVSALLATVGGGQQNSAAGEDSTISGGSLNTASGAYSIVGGGGSNTASGQTSTLGGGVQNTASGSWSTVGGGASNTASGTRSAVAGGDSNMASGFASAVPGGQLNTASGSFSFAAGNQAKATQAGSFVWGDSTNVDLTSPGADTFTVRASGGIWLGKTSNPSINPSNFIETSTGASLTNGGMWTNLSDRALKHDFRPLDKRTVLEKVARMPITSWSYKAEQPSIRHIGPMAQDFYTAFGLGLDDKHISTIDEGGVALAAIQGLYRQNTALQRENRALRAQLAAQNKRLTKLEQAFSKLSQ